MRGHERRSAAEVTVALLADNLQLIAAVGELRWREWGHAPEPEQLAWWVDVTGREAGRAALPITWVAIDALGQAVGAVGLGEFDIAERRDRSPWVLGMIADAHRRGAGIGEQLLAALEAWAGQHGYAQAWVATGDHAIAFYQKCGWQVAEIVEQQSGSSATVLTKVLCPSDFDRSGEMESADAPGKA